LVTADWPNHKSICKPPLASQSGGTGDGDTGGLCAGGAALCAVLAVCADMWTRWGGTTACESCGEKFWSIPRELSFLILLGACMHSGLSLASTGARAAAAMQRESPIFE